MRKSVLFILLAVMVVSAGSAFFYLRAKSMAQFPTTRLEADQVILPDGHPEFPVDTAWVIVQGAAGPIEVPVPLSLPAGWSDKVHLRVEGNIAYYDCVINADHQQPVFTIAALTEEQWQAEQAAPGPHGEAIFTYSGIVYIYNIPLENLYSGVEADEFSSLVGASREVASSLASYFTVQP